MGSVLVQWLLARRRPEPVARTPDVHDLARAAMQDNVAPPTNRSAVQCCASERAMFDGSLLIS